MIILGFWVTSTTWGPHIRSKCVTEENQNDIYCTDLGKQHIKTFDMMPGTKIFNFESTIEPRKGKH